MWLTPEDPTMLLPIFDTANTTPLSAIIFFGQERDMSHGFFGDRDANTSDADAKTFIRGKSPCCGLFGRRGDTAPPRPVPGDDPATSRQASREQD
jgi:hypothetical protein